MELMIGVLFGGILALCGVVLGSRTSHSSPAAAEPSGKPEPEERDAEELKRSREIDEGIQNLMTFSVNGKDGFDGYGTGNF